MTEFSWYLNSNFHDKWMHFIYSGNDRGDYNIIMPHLLHIEISVSINATIGRHISKHSPQQKAHMKFDDRSILRKNYTTSTDLYHLNKVLINFFIVHDFTFWYKWFVRGMQRNFDKRKSRFRMLLMWKERWFIIFIWLRMYQCWF